jgi:hypothetical protein
VGMSSFHWAPQRPSAYFGVTAALQYLIHG